MRPIGRALARATHLDTDVDTLALPTREAAARGVADDGVAVRAKPQQVDDRVDPHLQLAARRVGGQSQLGGEGEKLHDGQRREHDVVLRHEADQLVHLTHRALAPVELERAACTGGANTAGAVLCRSEVAVRVGLGSRSHAGAHASVSACRSAAPAESICHSPTGP
eukprot:870436-Prymnesium_polylepis.2